MSPATDDRPCLALIGLRCAGKTSVGRLLAARLGLAFRDLDEELARLAAARAPALAAPLSAGECFARLGEPAFRELEVRALEALLAPGAAGVLATGGGAVESASNRQRLAARARCVWLDASDAVLAARLRADPAARPAVLGGDAAAELPALRARREAHYRALAGLRVDTGSLSQTVVADRIVQWLEQSGAAHQRRS